MSYSFQPQRPAAQPVYVPAKPTMTYGLLGAIGVTFLLQMVSIAIRKDGGDLHNYIFTIDTDWYLRPWVLVTSTFAHSPVRLVHILMNGMFLYFIGPTVEQILGRRRYLIAFLLSGAASGVAQVHISAAIGDPGPALGASGALMMCFGTLMVVIPKSEVLFFGIVPMKMWVMGIVFVLIDIAGAFNPYDSIGNFAHLAGLAIGMAVGWQTRKRLLQRQMSVFGR